MNSGVINRFDNIFKAKKVSVPKEKHIHLVLKKDDIPRLENLRSYVPSRTQTEVFTSALQLFEAMVEECNQGSVFYVERPGEKPEKIDILG